MSPCFPFRYKDLDESDEAYVARLGRELDGKFQRLGPQTICAFAADPVVGATLGCVPPTPQYFKAMKAVYDKYGALLILDKVICRMGRAGTLHAWPQEGVVPDIQTLRKCLNNGYQSIAGELMNYRTINAFTKGNGSFSYGHIYQGHFCLNVVGQPFTKV